MTNELEPLKECPYCGNVRTLELTDCVEIEACSHFEECHSDHAKCVVCNVNKGGCGASGGFAYTEEEAIKKWNTRYKRTCKMEPHPDFDFMTCSICGYEDERNIVFPVGPDDDLPYMEYDGKFCPHCGSEVVDA